jgi:high-affinity iron transporter
MFATALIVFRESLEAALFIGIVAAATSGLIGRGRWLGGGVGLGMLCALVLALMAEQISSWADGVGQDMVNIGILSLALAMLLWHCVWISTRGKEAATEARQLGDSVQQGRRKPWALLIAVALAVLREGAETVLFVAGSMQGSTSPASAALLPSAIGLIAGVLVGGVLYLGLSRIPIRALFRTTNVLIGLLAASMASQLAKTLTQAGFIETGVAPLWDSSSAIDPSSAIGTLLHALVGYDAQPSGVQLISYVAVLALIYLGVRFLSQQRHRG